MRCSALTIAAAVLAGCGASERFVPHTTLLSLDDARGDTRLEHPALDGVAAGTFDLTHFALGQNDRFLIVTARFASRVTALRGVRLGDDRVADVFPQTVDVYLDTGSGKGAIAALPDRGFHVPSSQAWDTVLVLSSIRELREDNVVYPVHLIARGKELIGVFRRGEVVGEIQGVLPVVLATSPRGNGRVRLAHKTWRGDCQTWNEDLCTLRGAQPPILDSLQNRVTGGQPLALAYLSGTQPPAERIPVVFGRGELITAAPVKADRVRAGGLATVLDKTGTALATAVVVSVVGDTASLKLLGGARASKDNQAVAVIFAPAGHIEGAGE
ncbi:MAG: hypothetical protein ACI9WU_001215 [Myxococcota bacterium]|jgi:hypothetical protein